MKSFLTVKSQDFKSECDNWRKIICLSQSVIQNEDPSPNDSFYKGPQLTPLIFGSQHRF